MFKFERLDVWHKSKEFGKLCFEISESLLPKYQFSFGEQLRRAFLSITNNIAEGSGRESLKEQSNFYNMAKGSVYEVVNILMVLNDMKLLKLNAEREREIYELADEICKMLSGLIRRKNNVK